MLTWLQCAPLSPKWPFQQESLDFLCGGLELLWWKEQKKKLSSLNTRLVTDAVSYLLNFFWLNKIQGQLGFRRKGNRLLPNKRSGIFLQGRKNCWDLWRLFTAREVVVSVVLYWHIYFLDKVPCYKFNSVVVEFCFFGFIKNSSEWLSNIKLLITFFPVLIQRSFL